MANLGLEGVPVEDLHCANCGAAITTAFIAHGDTREGLAEAMPALARLAAAVVQQHYAERNEPPLCAACAPPKPTPLRPRRPRNT